MTDLAKLRAVAEAATQGKWRGFVTGILCRNAWVVHNDPGRDGAIMSDYDATHIATFDPPTVLQLLDDLAEARAIARRHVVSIDAPGPSCDEYDADAATIAKWRDDDEIS